MCSRVSPSLWDPRSLDQPPPAIGRASRGERLTRRRRRDPQRRGDVASDGTPHRGRGRFDGRASGQPEQPRTNRSALSFRCLTAHLWATVTAARSAVFSSAFGTFAIGFRRQREYDVRSDDLVVLQRRHHDRGMRVHEDLKTGMLRSLRAGRSRASR